MGLKYGSEEHYQKLEQTCRACKNERYSNCQKKDCRGIEIRRNKVKALFEEHRREECQEKNYRIWECNEGKDTPDGGLDSLRKAINSFYGEMEFEHDLNQVRDDLIYWFGQPGFGCGCEPDHAEEILRLGLNG